MSDFLRDLASSTATEVVLVVGGFVAAILAGWMLKFGWVRRMRNWVARKANIPRVEASSHYGFSLDNWSPVGSVDDPPPARDATLPWALTNGGGPLTRDGSTARTIVIRSNKPVTFEILRVWVTYKRQDLPPGTAFLNVLDGLGAGLREPACFVATLGHEERMENRVAAKHVVDLFSASEATTRYRASEATDLEIDLQLTFLSEGIYTYSVAVDLLVNGSERTLKIERAKLQNRDQPIVTVFTRDPELVHEEFVTAPFQTRWTPGERPRT